MKSKALNLIDKFMKRADQKYDSDHFFTLKYVFDSAEEIAGKLTKTNSEAIGNQMDSIGLSNESGKRTVVDAIAFLIFTHVDVKDSVNPYDYGFKKWEQVELNDWDWFSEELSSSTYIGENDVFYMLRSNVIVSDLEMPFFNVIKAPNKDMLKLIEVMHAQSFIHGLSFNWDERCFVSGDVKVFEDYAIEISEGAFNELSGLHKPYGSIGELGALCNSEEVGNSIFDHCH
jgi:hypothetical protein